MSSMHREPSAALEQWQVELMARAHIETFAAATRFGMSEAACERYASAAVDTLVERLGIGKD